MLIQEIRSFENDLYVKPEAAQQGYEAALLARAIELNSPCQMMAVVDAEAKSEIELYAVADFYKMEGQNSIMASYRVGGVSPVKLYERTTK